MYGSTFVYQKQNTIAGLGCAGTAAFDLSWYVVTISWVVTGLVFGIGVAGVIASRLVCCQQRFELADRADREMDLLPATGTGTENAAGSGGGEESGAGDSSSSVVVPASHVPASPSAVVVMAPAPAPTQQQQNA